MTGNQVYIVLPDFLIIGAGRSGTTTLYSYLQEHPAIYLPASKRPEPHYFLKEREYAKGLAYYSRKYFSEWQGESAIGEASVSYMCHKKVARRIRKHLPDVKLIAILRDPADRAYSNYWHTVKNGLETLSFDEAIQAEEGRNARIEDPFLREVQPYAYLERGFYYEQLSAYLEYFSREQLLVLLLDDLAHRPTQVLHETFSFLGVDAAFVPKSMGHIKNRSTPPGLEMSTETRRLLVKQYREDIDRLSILLERDLSDWKE